MKSIKAYINMIYHFPEQFNESNKWQTFDEFLDLNEIQEDNFTKKDIQEYFSRNYSVIGERYVESQINWIKHITENLNSHDSSKLIGKLNEKFSNWIVSTREENNQKNNNITITIHDDNPIVGIHSIEDELFNDTKEGNEFQHLIDLYGYYLTYVEYNGDFFNITLEPFFTKNMNEQIRENGNKIYHICSKETAEKIKNTNIFRTKVGKTPAQDSKTGYRYFPRRLFFIMQGKTNEDTIEEIQMALETKNLFAKEYVIFEIDTTYYLGKNKFQENGVFWSDNAMEKSKLSIYTYNAVPFNWCTNEWNSIEEMKKDKKK